MEEAGEGDTALVVTIGDGEVDGRVDGSNGGAGTLREGEDG